MKINIFNIMIWVSILLSILPIAYSNPEFTVTYPSIVYLHFNCSDGINMSYAIIKIKEPDGVYNTSNLSIYLGDNADATWLFNYTVPAKAGSYNLTQIWCYDNADNYDSYITNIYFDVNLPVTGGGSSSGGGGSSSALTIINQATNLSITPKQIDSFIFYTSLDGDPQAKYSRLTSNKKVTLCQTDDLGFICIIDDINNMRVGYNITSSNFFQQRVSGTVKITSENLEIKDIPVAFTIINLGYYIETLEFDIPNFASLLFAGDETIKGIRAVPLTMIALALSFFIFRPKRKSISDFYSY